MKSVNVYFDTLGCAKNQVDTSKMEESLVSAGVNAVQDANDADAIILNTCAFIEMAAQESIDTFFEYKNFYHDKKIIVCGCLVSRYKDDLAKSMPEADAFVTCEDEDKLLEVIEKLNIEPTNSKTSKSNDACVFSYVKISDGCNRRCSYCTIPSIRGKYKSSQIEEILEDINKEVEKGSSEIVLVAQDCGVWGQDFGSNLSQLLNETCSKYKDVMFRLLYVYPETIDNDLLACFKNNSNLVKYIDMPIQHCNDDILKSMGRKASSASLKMLCSKLRSEVPGIVLRTTVMSGYPGECDAQHNELCEFLSDVQFDYVGCFEYSAEDGTRAAKMLNQVSSVEKYARANELREICDEISLNKLSNKVGETFDVLIEGEEDGQAFGRAYFQAPEIDGYVYLSETGQNKLVKPGTFVRVKIVEQQGYDLVGVLDE